MAPTTVNFPHKIRGIRVSRRYRCFNSRLPTFKARKRKEVLLISKIMQSANRLRLTRPSRARPLQVLLVMLGFSVGLGGFACSSSSSAPALAAPVGNGGSGNQGGQSNTGGRSALLGDAGGSVTVSGTCTIGDSISCRVVIGTVNNQESCMVGMQYCDTGEWSHCMDPRDAG